MEMALGYRNIMFENALKILSQMADEKGERTVFYYASVLPEKVKSIFEIALNDTAIIELYPKQNKIRLTSSHSESEEPTFHELDTKVVIDKLRKGGIEFHA